jgi:hypothetical protein
MRALRIILPMKTSRDILDVTKAHYTAVMAAENPGVFM